jgi:hypothetical protein
MTTYTIELASDRGVIDIEADEVTTRQDGSLWLLVATSPPPAKLVPVLILARGVWLQVGSSPLPAPATVPAKAKAETPPPRVLPATAPGRVYRTKQRDSAAEGACRPRVPP